MAKNKIIASIIIPTFNRPEQIKETIKSIKDNKFPKEKFEIIIIDDGSKEDYSKTISQLKKKYSNIKYYKNKKNLGPSSSRNKGISISKGEIILFTDDDCIVPKNWVKTYVDFLEKNKKVAGVGGCTTPSSENLVGKIERLKEKILKINVSEIKIGKEEIPTGFTGNMSYRKKILKEFKGFNEKLKRGEDMDLKERISKKYSLAAHPLLVIHKHDFNFDYLLSRIIKEGLDTQPSGGKFKKTWIIISRSPKMIYKVIKKTIKYRKNAKQ